MPRLPPAEKIPLALRKNVRDEYENCKADLEKQLSTALGVEWKIDLNPLAIYPYAPEGGYAQRSLGGVLKAYIEGAVSQLNYFNGRFPDIGKQEVNTICHAHTLIMDLDETEKLQYNGCDIVDGKLRILFVPAYLGTNVGDALSLLPDVLNAAEQPAGSDGKPPVMGPQARMSIAKDWDGQIGALQTKVDKMLNASIKLNPMWDENFAKLKAAKDVRRSWERDYGSLIYQYFEGALGQLNYHKFGEDEMLQEGLLEAVEKKEIAFRVVDKLTLNNATYNDCTVEDGVLYIQTLPNYFGTNVGDACYKLMDIL